MPGCLLVVNYAAKVKIELINLKKEKHTSKYISEEEEEEEV